MNGRIIKNTKPLSHGFQHAVAKTQLVGASVESGCRTLKVGMHAVAKVPSTQFGITFTSDPKYEMAPNAFRLYKGSTAVIQKFDDTPMDVLLNPKLGRLIADHGVLQTLKAHRVLTTYRGKYLEFNIKKRQIPYEVTKNDELACKEFLDTHFKNEEDFVQYCAYAELRINLLDDLRQLLFKIANCDQTTTIQVLSQQAATVKIGRELSQSDPAFKVIVDKLDECLAATV